MAKKKCAKCGKQVLVAVFKGAPIHLEPEAKVFRRLFAGEPMTVEACSVDPMSLSTVAYADHEPFCRKEKKKDEEE